MANANVVNALMRTVVMLRERAPRTFVRMVRKARNSKHDLWPMDREILYQLNVTTSPNEDAVIHDAYIDLIANAVTGKGIKMAIRSPFKDDETRNVRIVLKNGRKANQSLVDAVRAELESFQDAHPIEFGELVRLSRNPQGSCSKRALSVFVAHNLCATIMALEMGKASLGIGFQTILDPIVAKILPLCVEGDRTLEMVVGLPYDLDQFEDRRMPRANEDSRPSSNGDGHAKTDTHAVPKAKHEPVST
jgi:hypothetical protein